MPAGYRINKFGDGFALVYWTADGKRHRYRLNTADPRQAEHLAPALFAELTRPKGSTVAALWRAYEDDMKGRAVLATMKHTWKALSARFGDMEGSQITIADCRAHIEARRSGGIKDGTIHTELGHLRMVLLWAAKHRLIVAAPPIERPAKPKSGERHLSVREVSAVAKACSMPHLTLFVYLAFATAGRPGAITGLTWDRVDFEREKIDLEDPDIDIPHKGRAIVPMNRTTKIRLLEAREGARTPYVIEWAGKPVSSVKKGLATAARLAGVKKCTPHMLRHSAAVKMAEDGVPMEEIASYLGHSDVRITRTVYAKFSPNHLRNAASSLELDDTEPRLAGSAQPRRTS